uniref:Uncharacterized protein n=1 Tax=Chlamydomonas leiostraca TaxID=1034604 RepID=A0A7S0RRV9_9CHLO|mmetsp:Transcript_28916/g.73846  ORF Transcript_28916/g.73846 Transcript_28916/m.73846 type:complete len:437 (+) Transcript_28916:91-1401(+)|eukprot:CAMPEP_0202858420 /NCGR_PEP_ID=MMETSP1391-20130828/964_1 /ASSEMBLY_ACC=CAM_ASM_000867 /TAXON_ID=1034604 /ORGANISM="Chlamydomonas leiostraca, Strain SAG 11-49" /LENGTH=436 /DNA_ID=CAMNT_0049537341 /DNA_START=80 /DNA_END=1390 /DNA_ORIENTATION=-
MSQVDVQQLAAMAGVQGAVVVSAGKPAAEKMTLVDGNALTELSSIMDASKRAVNKLSESVAPWTISKNKKRATTALAELEQQKQMLLNLLSSTLTSMQQARTEVANIKKERDNAVEQRLAAEGRTIQLESDIESNQAQIEKLSAEVAELQAAKKKALSPAELAAMLEKVEEAGVGPKRYLKLDAQKEVETLQRRLEALVADHDKLRTENEKLTRARNDAVKKAKEWEAKAKDEAEVREREVKRLAAELKRAGDAKDEAVAAARLESADTLAARTRELKNLQRRVEASKGEMDGLRAREKTFRGQLDEANAVGAKAQEEARAAARKAGDMRAARDEVARELEGARAECSMVAAELKACVPKEAALANVRAFYNKSAAWPRHAFTVRGSCVLHTGACEGWIDVGRVMPREYGSHKELEGWVAGEGVVLCRNCRCSGGF